MSIRISHACDMAENWQRVADFVKRRRAELGLSQRDAANAASISATTWLSVEKHANPCTPLTAAAMAGALQWPGQAFEAILEGTPYEEIPTTLEESRPSQVRRHPSQQADGDFTSRWTDAMNELVEVAEGIRRAENVHRVRRFAESVRDEEIQDWIEDRVQSMVKDAGYTPEQAFRALMGYDAPLRDGSDEEGDDFALAADADTLEGDAPTSYVSRPGGAPAEDGEHLDG